MSQDQLNPPISGALMLRAEAESPSNVPQPRQPHNLQGLLRYAMEVQAVSDQLASDETEPQRGLLDDEQRQFLEGALNVMNKDIVDVLYKNILILRQADKITPESDLTEFREAFDFLFESIDCIDIAIDFHKLGGFVIFPACLTSSEPEIRAKGCEFLAECAQNNPYCQGVIIDSDLLEHALALVERDHDPQVRIKALYAVSCSIRDNPKALEKFLELGGLKTIVKVLREDEEKAKGKAAFLLGSLATTDPKLRDELITLAVIPLLGTLVAKERGPAHEHMIALLWKLVENNPVAIDICTQPELRLINILTKHMNITNGKEEMREEGEYCYLLLKQLNQVLPDPPETDR